MSIPDAPTPTRDQCISDAADVLLAAAIRIEADRLHKAAFIEMSPDRLLSVASAASMLDTSADYVYERIRAGDLPVVELGHGRPKQRIRYADMVTFINSRRFPPAS